MWLAPQHGATALWAACLGLLKATAQPAQPCTSEKIFARSVADECGPPDHVTSTLDWTGVIGELFEARNAVFWEGPAAARDQLVNLLTLVGQSYELASQCPAAVAATSYSLAEVIASEGLDEPRQLKQLALLQFALAILPTGAHQECTQWPLRGRDLVAAFQQLSTTVFSRFSAKPASVRQEPSVAVVTACAGIHLAGVRAGSRMNRELYAAKHGYDLYFFQDAKDVLGASPAGTNLTCANAPAYWRAYALQSVMALHISYSWLLWMDCDVVVTNLDTPVSTLLAKHGIVQHAAGRSVSMLISASSFGVDPELFLLRNDAWGQELLRNWTRLPSPSFLHPGQRRPLDARHPERLALQHAVLPHWGAWVHGRIARDWALFQWQPEVRLLWQPGDFAWVDFLCRGRAGLFNEASCLNTRSRILNGQKKLCMHMVRLAGCNVAVR